MCLETRPFTTQVQYKGMGQARWSYVMQLMLCSDDFFQSRDYRLLMLQVILQTVHFELQQLYIHACQIIPNKEITLVSLPQSALFPLQADQQGFVWLHLTEGPEVVLYLGLSLTF